MAFSKKGRKNIVQKSTTKFKKLGLMFPSPQTFVDSSDSLEEFNFETLIDKRNQVARQFGIVLQIPEKSRIHYENLGIYLPRYNGDESFELPIPATFIVNQDGKIHYAFIDSDFTERLDPVEIVTILRQMTV